MRHFALSCAVIASTLVGLPMVSHAQTATATTTAAAPIGRADHTLLNQFLGSVVRTPSQLAPMMSRRQGAVVGSRIDAGAFTEMDRPVVNSIPFDLMQSEHRDAINSYLLAIQKLDPRTLSPGHQTAYWLNLHNAAFIKRIMDLKMPRGSRAIDPAQARTSDYLDAPVVSVAGQSYTVRQLRLHIVSTIDDPSVVYGLWTGMIGGPQINPWAFDGDRINEQLTRVERAFVRSGFALENERGTVKVSELYDFYRPLFKDDAAILTHLREAGAADVPQAGTRLPRFFERRVAYVKLQLNDSSQALGTMGTVYGSQQGMSGQ